MNTGPNWITTAGFLVTATELVSVSLAVQASGGDVTYKKISGNLPTGISVSTSGTIFGIPGAVLNTTEYNFVIRASNNSGISDRSFRIDVQGSQDPIWNTSTGYFNTFDYNTSTAYLPLEPKGQRFALDKQWVYYQFQASANSAPTGTKIRYFIPENGGELPPGLYLNQDGILSGFLSDDLVFDGTESDTGGYDEEIYDGFSYDHGITALDSVGVPKIYQFRVSATDGVRSKDRFFKILVVSPEMIRNPERIQMALEPGLFTTNSNYLPPLQFINGNDLGRARAENNETFDISAYNAYPLLGSVRYEIIEGTERSTQLPNFLKLDSSAGVIYGYIPYQPAYTENYEFTVNAIRTYGGTSTITVNTFTLAIQGEIENSIEWISTSTLGVIYQGRPSELAVSAKRINSDYDIKYRLTNGVLPDGLTLERDGSISGSAEYGTTGTYVFSVRAEDVAELSAIDRTFTLEVKDYNGKKYTKIWTRPFLELEKRNQFRDFMTDTFVFPQDFMYRYFDPNFGVQTEIKLILEFGIERQNLIDYTPALRECFYRRKFYFGDIKLAIAKNSQSEIIYELVYIDIVDPMKTNSANVSRVLYTNNDIYYPGSIDNMRYQLEHLVLNNGEIIDTDEFNMPLFMRTAQYDSYKPAGYMHVMPLCYALPGQGQKIISRIKLKEFDFKQFNLDIDRLIIDKTEDNNTAKYLLFPRQNITDRIESDSIIYVYDETPLETDQNLPINRES